MNVDEVRSYDGQSVIMTLTPGAPAGLKVKGQVVGFVEAADGFVVVLCPEGAAPDARTSVHYQHIVSIATNA